tara:strand:+ start:7808 stop:8926 length:1119 start_codon:yes stop_codon:yes gene_type:complete
MSLFKRVREKIEERRERILSGKVNCIPWGLPRFEEESPGIEQGKYYLDTANSKVGKTQIADHLFMYNPIQQVIDNNLNVRLKIFYFTLEMTKEEKMLSSFSNILFIKEGIRISPKDLKSTKSDNILPKEYLDIIDKYKDYFAKIEEVVEFIDDIRNPTGIYNLLREYANNNGTQHKKKVQFVNNKTGEIFEKEIDDWYEPNDPDEYVIIIIDHISLISTEKENGRNLTTKESIDKLSSNYLVRLRNKYNYIPVVIQQQAAAQESLENAKFNKLKPSLDGLGDSKLTQRDANVIFGLFSPYRHEIPKYLGYDIEFFKDNIRFLEIIGGREGGAGTICPLYFDGAVNYFKELPLPNNEKSMEGVYRFIKKWRNN